MEWHLGPVAPELKRESAFRPKPSLQHHYVLEVIDLTTHGHIHNMPSHLTLRWTDQDISQLLPLAAD
jgi:hypothetical protein